MEGATHFIEVYKVDNGLIASTGVNPIERLQLSLNFTKFAKCKTICVWQMKLKPFKTLPKNNNTYPEMGF